MDSFNPDDLNFPQTSSNLSPYFLKLICTQCISEKREPRVLNKEDVLDFDFVSGCLPESLGPETDSTDYFTESVRILAPMLNSLEQWISLKGEAAICEKLSELTLWTNQQKMMSELFNMMLANDDISDIAILLAATAILERALEDVYLINGPAPCPSMLKDVLVSPALVDLLGNSVIQVLRLVIGPPISLNIRNVVWHGFPLPGEIPRRCIWFILLLVPSIGHILYSKTVTDVKHRESAIFPDVSLIQDQDVLTDDETLTAVTTSRFVSWNTKPFWNHVRKLYKDGKKSLCAGLLCYYLEQGLRRVFTVVNKCENRILTAESSTLFTTFDEILNPFQPDNSKNKLQYILGEPMMEILMDHLVYQDGPRLRDRLSHGEADWFSFPLQLIDNLLTVCISLALSFSSSEIPNKDVGIAHLQSSIQSYRVQFHRISLIKKTVFQLYQEIAEFDSLIVINTDLTLRADSKVHSLTEDHLKFEEMVKGVSNELKVNWTYHANILEQDHIVESIPYNSNTNCHSAMERILTLKIPTLYRGAKPTDMAEVSQSDSEGEILSILDHVTTECWTTLKQICNFAHLRQQQFGDKQLRSRQRENFKKFLASFPSFIVALKLYGYLVTWQLYHLDAIKTYSNKDNGSLIRYWKSILQCCENLRTCTHMEKNKWTEGLDLINKHVTQLLSTMNKLFIK